MTMRTVRALAASVALIGVPHAFVGAQPPSLAGEWELSEAKSHLGLLHGQFPTQGLLKVEQTSTSVKVTADAMTPAGRATHGMAEYALTGKATPTRGPQGMTLLNTGRFVGAVLETETTIVGGAAPVTRKARWTVAPDGRTLTVDQSIGLLKYKLVYDRTR